MKKWFAALSAAALACASLVVAQPADAQEKKVRAQMAGAFPSNMLILGAAELRTVDYIKRLSNGTIDIKFFEPGALVPGSQYFDAVGSGSLDMAYTAAGYFTGKDIAFAMFTTVPFGPDASEFFGWFEYGGGNKIMQELHAKYGIVAHNCGLIPPEASGWFRKEIKTADDFKGLKMRFFGLGANVMQKMGVATQLLQAGEIFQALQLGTIDATEFSMPTMDLSLGFHQVAKFYYFPGWHQQTSIGQLYISKKKWDEFSPWQKDVVELACKAQMLQEVAEADAKQAAAMKELQSKGVQIKKWDPAIVKALEEKWLEVVKEESSKSENFKKVWESYSKFRADYAIWREHGYMK
ncbi:MAG: TRAP transporter substrate-binding protein [Hyphomicrobiaceae bacterium]|nr:TRAP transporter substrate-binding protein [Hyphomicrobiaceae bacterium]